MVDIYITKMFIKKFLPAANLSLTSTLTSTSLKFLFFPV